MSFRRLTPRQVAFVRAFVRDGGRSATQAAREAGYSARTAHAIAHQQLQRDHVLAAIGAEPGGRAVLERLAQRSRSPDIGLRAAMLLAGTGYRVMADAEHITVYTDPGAAAARRYAVAHGDESGPAEAENGPNPAARVDTEG